MKSPMVLAEFECQGFRFALPLASVRRVLPSAQPTPLPGAPAIVLGILNLGDEIAVIVNFSQRVSLPVSGMQISQQLLLIDLADICIGLLVDRVCGILTREINEKLSIPKNFAADECISTIIRMDDGLCVICDPEKFLLEDEKFFINDALEQLAHAAH
jgi:chemotaxis signal transduction protein